MIPRTVPTWQVETWQDELKQLIDSPETLIELVALDPKWLPAAQAAAKLFPVRATRSYVSRIRRDAPHDPLLRQILPLAEESLNIEGYSDDPLEEDAFTPCPGVIHKYHSRVLFIAATQCAINCRYCFRRHFPYQDNQLSRSQWLKALDYVRSTPSINEVILSGGDPLSLSDRQLSWLVENIADIPHIRRLRVHTRYPIILPSRITTELTEALSAASLDTVIVNHCNHPQEIDQMVHAGFERLREAGFTLFNQAVLLRGVNDCANTLSKLSETLFSGGVLPYYLHMLDPVRGAAHFAVTEADARDIYRTLLATLPGYLVPKLVREIPHEQSKTPVNLYLNP